jgi:diguanylate cyclase (GGDEF)-like protein
MAVKKSGFLHNLSLVPAGLRCKLMISFSLMSVIPMMICVYITTNFVFPYLGMTDYLGIIIAITIIIALLGLILAKRMIEPIIDIAIEAKLMAAGDLERFVDIAEEGEIGALAISLNAMSEQIRANLTELKSYEEKTVEINAEIHRKVMALSGLLQVGNMISSGTELKTTLDILVEKISLANDSCPAMLMLIDSEKNYLVPYSVMNIVNPEAAKTPFSSKKGFFASLKTHVKDIVVDNSHDGNKYDGIDLVRESLGIKNIALVPIVVKGALEGVVFIANNKDGFVYKKDVIELLYVFSKQAAIAVENDVLLKKSEALEVKDGLTQLYNAKFIRERLDEEIKRAMTYQRPCSFILFNVDNYKDFCIRHGNMAGESVLKKIAKIITDEITLVDRAGRFDDNEFAIILPERSKKEANNIAKELRQKISNIKPIEATTDNELPVFITVSGSVSENPIDGLSAKELVDKAKDLLKQAKEQGKDKVTL